MKLVLYSGGSTPANHELHGALADLVGNRRRRRITYVPFCSDDADIFFRRFIRRYKPFGFTDFQFFPVDEPVNLDDLDDALSADVVYLSGGNTFYFLHHLRANGLLGKLREYVDQGGILAGLSAGAILMTPHIGLAGYPDNDRDENEVGLTQLQALGLVSFEFFPHYHGTRLERSQLRAYAQQSGTPLIAARDGAGVVVDRDSMTYCGGIELFMGSQHSWIHR